MSRPRDHRPGLFRRVLGQPPVPADVRRRIAEQALLRVTGARVADQTTHTRSGRALLGPFDRPRLVALAAASLVTIGVVALLAYRLLGWTGPTAEGDAPQVVVTAPEHPPRSRPAAAAQKVWSSESKQLPVLLGAHRIVLAPRTRVRLRRRHRASVDLALESGKASFAVRKLQRGATFRVQTPEVQIEVVGTRFSVSTTDGCTQVSVDSGRVRVTASDGAKVMLGAGEHHRRCARGARPPLETRSDAEKSLARALLLIEQGDDAAATTLLWQCVGRARGRATQRSLVAREALFHLTLLQARRGDAVMAHDLARRYVRDFGGTPRACRLRRTVLDESCAGR